MRGKRACLSTVWTAIDVSLFERWLKAKINWPGDWNIGYAA